MLAAQLLCYGLLSLGFMSDDCRNSAQMDAGTGLPNTFYVKANGVHFERAGAWMRFSDIEEYTKSTSVSMMMIMGVPVRFNGDVLQYHVTLFIF